LNTFDGHFSAHFPQEVHLAKSTTGINVSRLMHCSGQFFTQRPHLKQDILQVLATICFMGFLFEQRGIAPFWFLGTLFIIA
jgi:hypothetical protein